MSWDDFTREAEERAQRTAGKHSKEIKKLHKAQLAKLNAQIDALYAQVLDKGAESLTRTQLYQYSKYQALVKTLDEGVAEQRHAQNAAVEASIRQVYTSTLEQSLDALLGKSGWNVVPESLLEQYLKIDWSGRPYSKRIWKNTNALAAQVKEHIGDMIVQGKNPGTIKKQLMEDFGVSYDVADRLITTEASHAYNSAAIEGYRQTGLTQVKYLLDPGGNVCDRCRAYATETGGVYPIEDAPNLPVHPRCHCCYAPVVDLSPKNSKNSLLSQEKGDIINQVNRISSPRQYEPMDSARRDRMIDGLKRAGADVVYGDEAEDYLNWAGANRGQYIEAATLGNQMFFRTNPSASAVYEEAIHFAQAKRGPLGSGNMYELELEAAEKLIRNRKAYGITDAEHAQNIKNRDYYKALLKGGET